MLNMNGKISRDVSRDDTMWLKRPELKVKKVFNWQISRNWELLVEVMCGLSKERSREINDKKEEKEKYFWLKDRSLKSERRYGLVVRLKAIKCKKDFLCYLSSTASLVFRPVHSCNPF